MNCNDVFESPDEELTLNDFLREIKLVREKGKKNYFDLVKAGKGLQMEIFKFLKHILNTEEIP